MAALAVELGSSWRDVPAAGRRRLRARRRAGRRLPPPGALHRDHRGRARRGRQRAVRAARARGGDPPALHRADPAGPRRARDPRRAVRGGRQPGRAEDAGGSLVYYVSGPPGDDLALSAWADVHRAEDRGESRRGHVRRRGPAAGLLLGAADGARAGEPARRLRPRGGGAGRAGGGDRPARPAARRAAARALARRVPVRPGRRARRGGRRAPPRRGARASRAPAAARCCRWSPPGARRRSRAARRARATRPARGDASPTASPGRGSPATCAPRCPRPGSPCCSARATSTC